MKPSKELIKPLLLLTLIVLIFAFITRTMSRSETLAEYANSNPSIAYQKSSEESDEVSSSDESTDLISTTSLNVSDNSISGDSSLSNNQTVSANSSAQTTLSISANSTSRVTYQQDFYYEPLSDTIKSRINGISYAKGCTVLYEDLRYMNVLYLDFNGKTQHGELICATEIADDLVSIFYELYQAGYQIDKIRLIDEYGGNDTLSMEDDNTSCFNYRVVDNSTTLSKHALGRAIDINPFYNPYVTYPDGVKRISPNGSEEYADRSKDFPYKIDENDLCYKLFIEHGFTWGGNWNSCKDYQHFQK